MYTTLQKYFGYTSFYPLQEDIINEALGKRDSLVLMPTGGGKSLCYQLPALLFDGLTVVISPLISLMKDQVDGLLANGVAATFINSSLSYNEIDARMRSLSNNKIKILYIAPERLFMTEFLQFLKGLNVSLFAIDESHCISEWGHDFRPEYRQLKLLREWFPKVPIMALTATATPVVQKDIIAQLELSDCKVFKASFNRGNLYYKIKPKSNPYHQLLQYLETRKKDSGIIYCQSRKGVEGLAENLQTEGYRALPYHAGLTPEVRTETQERFIREDVEIVVATIAFGMGIDKSNVRYVIHYDLPKSIEGYYQETGRAGRDGLKSDCILFFSYSDRIKIEYFIKRKEDEKEKQVAYKQLDELVKYCESNVCRRRVLLDYFGEEFDEPNCGSCDICSETRERFDGTIAAQKILSCVYRVGERFTMKYVIDVLLGSRSQRVLKNRHNEVKTYGVGKEYSRPQWRTFIRELIQLGYLYEDWDEFHVLKLNEKSWDVLRRNEKVLLTKPEEEEPVLPVDKGEAYARTPSERLRTRSKALSDKEYDRTLFERLRVLRKTLADKAAVPPYVIFPDTSLKEMSVYFPQSLPDFRGIIGVGDQKLKSYGEVFIREITDYCKEHNITPEQIPHKRQEPPARKTKAKKMRPQTVLETLVLWKQGLTIDEIARKRGHTAATSLSHIERLILDGEDISLDSIVDRKKQLHIQQALKESDTGFLAPVKEKLGDDYSYEEIRLVRAKISRECEKEM